MAYGIGDIISKLTVKQLGQYISEYIELFLHPIDSWKKAYSSKNSSYNFVILHIVYYSVLVLILFKEIYFTVQVVILEVLITFIPFSVFLIPFLFFSRKSETAVNWKNMFRTFLIIKFQFVPIFVLLILFAQWSQIEVVYYLIDNGLLLIWMGMLLVVPIISKTSAWKKLAWVTMNYVFLVLFLTSIAYTYVAFVEPSSDLNKQFNYSPSKEYESGIIRSYSAINSLSDEYYLIVIESLDSNSIRIHRVQFVTHKLAYYFSGNSYNETLRQLIKYEKELSKSDSNFVPVQNEKKEIDVAVLNLEILDSLRSEFNAQFYSDKNLFKELKDSCRHKSNKEYFRFCYSYLEHMDSLFKETKVQEELLSSFKPKTSLQLDEKSIGLLYEIPEKYRYDHKKELNQLEIDLDKRYEHSNFGLKILLFPVIYFLDFLDI
ncbi:hypothetical protein KFE98_19740 [bacterium SCSIO 12741]|nr:hypothetical protein KFE98_19740 [bacterium SCSIO 12741]